MEKSDRNKNILTLANEGMTYEEIGIKHGISRQMVQSILKRSGFRKRDPQERNLTTSTEVFNFIIKHKQEWCGHGPFLSEISKEFNLSPQRVEKALKELEDFGYIDQFGDGVGRKIIVIGSNWIYTETPEIVEDEEDAQPKPTKAIFPE